MALTRAAIDILLVLIVLSAWLAALGFARLRAPLDRMHTGAFVNATAGAALVVLGFVSDGVSVRALKIVLIVTVNLVAGAAMSHATGRALTLRTARDAASEARR